VAGGAAYTLAPVPPAEPSSGRAEDARRPCLPGRVRFRGACVPIAACPPGRMPLSGICVRVAAPDAGVLSPPTLATNAHTEHDGTLTVYEIVPRTPDRPASYADFVYPVPDSNPIVTSGFDLDRPDREQRRGNPKNPVGHGGLDLARPIGTPMVSIPLERQEGQTRVLFEGMLFGRTVVTLHERPDGAYTAIHGHMDTVAPGIAPGATIAAGASLGTVGDSGTPGVPHLHYEVRYVRPGVDPWTLWGRDLWDNALAVPCDPRNVLPLRQ
ncbi:MAG: M23 family metallopeptidase, partial [Actinobacteria bacterium]|nr:M23 family metallopeptidase [Actinomycetota bacterium]